MNSYIVSKIHSTGTNLIIGFAANASENLLTSVKKSQNKTMTVIINLSQSTKLGFQGQQIMLSEFQEQYQNSSSLC